MARVAILGAGHLGGALAHRIAHSGRIAEVRLIDRAVAVATGKTLDIQQAGALAGFATRVVAEAEPEAAAGAEVIVLADDADPTKGEIAGDEALLLLQRLAAASSSSILLCAGAGHRVLIERAVRERGLDRARVVGSAPLALQGAIRAVVAAALDASATDVALTVLGVPPARTVVPWTSATLAGSPLSNYLDPPRQRRLDAQLPHLWPPGPQALASAAVRVIAAILDASRRLYPCFVVLGGVGDARNRAAAMPVRLGPGGIERVVQPALSRQEEVLLGNALAWPA